MHARITYLYIHITLLLFNGFNTFLGSCVEMCFILDPKNVTGYQPYSPLIIRFISEHFQVPNVAHSDATMGDKHLGILVPQTPGTVGGFRRTATPDRQTATS